MCSGPKNNVEYIPNIQFSNKLKNYEHNYK